MPPPGRSAEAPDAALNPERQNRATKGAMRLIRRRTANSLRGRIRSSQSQPSRTISALSRAAPMGGLLLELSTVIMTPVQVPAG